MNCLCQLSVFNFTPFLHLQFGGKLITFRKEAENGPRVTINQVITEPELVARSNKLEDVLANGNFVDFCRQKADETDDQHNRYVWYFLKANFEQDPRSEMLNLLGMLCRTINQQTIKLRTNETTLMAYFVLFFFSSDHRL